MDIFVDEAVAQGRHSQAERCKTEMREHGFQDHKARFTAFATHLSVVMGQ